MSLPTSEQLNELSEKVLILGLKNKGKWYTYKGCMQTLKRNKAKIAIKVTTKALNQMDLFPTGAMFTNLSTVLSPWIGVALVAQQSSAVMSLYDVMDAKKTKYVCNCGKCQENIRYVLDKKERNAALIATGVFTLGASTVLKKVHSISKWAYSKLAKTPRPKEQVSKELVISARDKKCTMAMVTIFILASNWESVRGGNEETMLRAISIIVSEDGWAQLKSEW